MFGQLMPWGQSLLVKHGPQTGVLIGAVLSSLLGLASGVPPCFFKHSKSIMFSVMYLGSWPLCRLLQITSKFFVSLLIFMTFWMGILSLSLSLFPMLFLSLLLFKKKIPPKPQVRIQFIFAVIFMTF